MSKNFFDFRNIISKEDGFDGLVKEAQKNVKTKSSSNSKSLGVFVYFTIAILAFSVIILGYINLTQKTDNTKSLEQIQDISTTENPNILAGNSFSILVNKNTPDNFITTNEKVDFVFLNGKKGVVTKILAKNELRNGVDESGIEVYSTEFDNRLNIKGFAQEVAKSLGNSYTLEDETIEIPKGFSLHKITNSSNQNLVYYTAVTSENYYVIKHNNTAKKHSSLSEYSEFIELFIPGLFLN
jgi:hypothetical protein